MRRPDVLGVDALRPGMKGYGLTVFQGTKPERFGVEIIDVLDNFRPQQELILIKTKHPRLDIAGVVAGMSGSPIFIDGKMIGAYAYGWTFGREPVAGVTPIKHMLDDLARPIPKQIYGVPLRVLPDRPGKQARVDRFRFQGPSQGYDLTEHAAQLARSHAQSGLSPTEKIAPVTTPILMGGLSTTGIEMARELLSPLGLEPLQAGGGGAEDPTAPTRFENGGAIGVQLVRGDISATGLGTVTRVEGDRLVAFGHPMMQAGVTALPTAVGKILWFLASEMRSFKIGMPVHDVGTLVNDRMASIVVSQDIKAPVIPVSLRIRGVPGAVHKEWNMEVAHEKFMTPSFLAIALGSAVEAVISERQDISWSARSYLKIKGFDPIPIDDYGVSIGGSPQAQDFMRANVVDAAGAVLNNPWQDVRVESVKMDIEMRYAREIVRLRGAELLESEIDAGKPARIRLTLQPFAGPDQTRLISVPIPAYLAGETLKLSIEPGYMVERERPSPESVDDLIANIIDPVYPPKSIVVSFASGAGGVAHRGLVAKNLPPGAMDSLQPRSSSRGPRAFRTQLRHVEKLPVFMVGKDSVSVEVRPILR